MPYITLIAAVSAKLLSCNLVQSGMYLRSGCISDRACVGKDQDGSIRGKIEVLLLPEVGER